MKLGDSMAAEFVDDLRLATDAEMSRSEDIAWTGREKDGLVAHSVSTRRVHLYKILYSTVRAHPSISKCIVTL